MNKEIFTNLTEKYGKLLYVYDASTINQRCSELYDFQKKLSALIGKTVRMHYSTKANHNPAILSLVKKAGLGVDCMSPLELTLNESCQFAQEDILYVCNNILADEMKIVHDKNLLICLDSISQVETWGKLFPYTSIMVRINPGITGVGHSEKVITSGKATKFGISESNIALLLDIAKHYDLKIVGTHQHLGSLFLNDKIDDYIAGVKAGLNIVHKYFKNLEIIDLGGGFGVPYKPEEEPLDLNRVMDKLVPILKEFIAKYPSVKEFKFEPGRYIPCEAGYLVGVVTAVKFENNRYWIGTNIGMNQIVRPSMYDSYHEITIFGDGELVTANICGNVCESGDILGKNRCVPLPKVGDIVVVHNAGAYGYSMASNYTCRLRPPEVLLDGNNIKLIRKGETPEDIMSKIVW